MPRQGAKRFDHVLVIRGSAESLRVFVRKHPFWFFLEEKKKVFLGQHSSGISFISLYRSPVTVLSYLVITAESILSIKLITKVTI